MMSPMLLRPSPARRVSRTGHVPLWINAMRVFRTNPSMPPNAALATPCEAKTTALAV